MLTPCSVVGGAEDVAPEVSSTAELAASVLGETLVDPSDGVSEGASDVAVSLARDDVSGSDPDGFEGSEAGPSLEVTAVDAGAAVSSGLDVGGAFDDWHAATEMQRDAAARKRLSSVGRGMVQSGYQSVKWRRRKP